MARLRILFLLLSLLVSLISASAPTFCKCTCFKNSTIIPLGPGHAAPAPPSPKPTTTTTSPSVLLDRSSSSSRETINKRAPSPSCAQCNRAACLGYNLPFCKDAEEKDVVAMCFQRDSRKDQVIVWGFILGTSGLLGWALIKRVLERSGGGTGVLGALGSRLGLGQGGRGVGGRTTGLGMGGGGAGGGLQQRRGGLGGNTEAERERGAYSPLGTGDGGRGSG